MRFYDSYEQEKNKKGNYSSYWLDFDDSSFDTPVEENPYSTERVVKLASVRRAVANFVRILTNDEKIRVVYSSGTQSYTNGKEVVIAAEDDAKHFDSMVGLALHEGSHCLLSDFNFLNNVMNSRESAKCVIALKKEIRDSFGSFDHAEIVNKINSIQKILGLIMNVIEDRRIDSYIYKNAVGYRPYYDAMYNKYFFNAEVTKNLKYNPEWREPTVENYINWLINIFHPDFDRNALPGLSEMVDIIDLKNIRRFDITSRMPEGMGEWKFTTDKTPWDANTHLYLTDCYRWAYLLDYDTLPKIWHTANDIFHLMMKYVANYQNSQKEDAPSDGSIASIDIDGLQFEIDRNGLENLDMNNSPAASLPKKIKFNKKKAKTAMDNMKKVMQGENRRKKLKQKEKKDIQNLENADAKLVEAGDKIVGKFPCLVLQKINKQIMESDVFPFTQHDWRTYNQHGQLYKHDMNERAVVKGMQMGQILAHRLQVRNDPQITHFTRQPHGKIDRHILAQLGMEIEQVFKRTTVENYRPAMLHLSLDASGSMQGRKWEKVIAVATALAYVSSKVDNIEVVITVRGDHDIPVVAVMYDSRVDRFQKARNLLPYLCPMGSTPEGLCFKATLDMITECAGEYDVYFINFSDGEPGCAVRRQGEYNNYGGETAVAHTRRQVQAMRDAGVKVLSYFIHDTQYSYTSSWNPFKRMYGENASNVNVENATEVIRTLNKLLLKRGE